MNNSSKIPIRKVCRTCGSDNVQVDAYAAWVIEIQDWELASCFEASVCEDCGGECRIIDVPAEFWSYDLTLVGFDGSTDATDDLVKWIAANTPRQALKYAEAMGWKVDNWSVCHEGSDNPPLTIEYGCDAVFERDGSTIIATAK